MKQIPLMLGLIFLLGFSYAAMTRSTVALPETTFPSAQPQHRRTLVMAHRGGAGLWPENTMYAFTRAVALGVDVLEMDVHSTRDGVLVVIHDETVDRTTNGQGRVSSLTLAELKKLDAAYNFSPGRDGIFPLRGSGVSIPTLEEVFRAFPQMRFNIDIKQKQPSLVKPLCRLIRERALASRVMVASFEQTSLDEFRKECVEVATSASLAEVIASVLGKNARPEGTGSIGPRALQVPESLAGRQVLTRELVEAAHLHKLEVHAWTINDEAAMQRVLELDVDGIITDYPDRLIALLRQGR